jgi:hypothetical protein
MIGGKKMINFAGNIIILIRVMMPIILIGGLGLCIKGMSNGSKLYKGGALFFLLMLIANIYSWFVSIFLDMIMKKAALGGGAPLGQLVYYLNIPGPAIQVAAFLVLVITLYDNLNIDQRKEYQ